MNLSKIGWPDCKQRWQTVTIMSLIGEKQQLIHGLDDEGMSNKILRKVSTLEDIRDAASK